MIGVKTIPMIRNRIPPRNSHFQARASKAANIKEGIR